MCELARPHIRYVDVEHQNVHIIYKKYFMCCEKKPVSVSTILQLWKKLNGAYYTVHTHTKKLRPAIEIFHLDCSVSNWLPNHHAFKIANKKKVNDNDASTALSHCTFNTHFAAVTAIFAPFYYWLTFNRCNRLNFMLDV